MTDSLGSDLRQFMLAQLPDNPDVPRFWRMSEEWWLEVRAMTDDSGRPVWIPGYGVGDPFLLYGFPVVVSDEATVPELVPQGGTA